MWLGIDLGTSAVKAVIVDDAGGVVASASETLTVQRPQPGWSEQDPEEWWQATDRAVRALPAPLRAALRGLGLTGQMHGAVLLDRAHAVLRPAILWNDGRADAQARTVDADGRSRAITGNAAMPGFTAPKLAWVRELEPQIFAATALVLLPKDYLRLRLTGDAATEVSDASGTLWLDVERRGWSDLLLERSGLERAQLPRLHEGNEETGWVREAVARGWGMPAVPVAAGASDNAAAAIAAGVVKPGDALLSLGTSGVLFCVTDGFRPAPDAGTHAFAHALPGRWSQMAVTLSAASAIDWAARATGFPDTVAAVAAAARLAPFAQPELFAPYLSGERTPHNDVAVRGAWSVLGHDSDPARLVAAALEGVAFALRDGLDALSAAGAQVGSVALAGGGAGSRQWLGVLAAALERPLERQADAEVGPALGAARLARLAVTDEPLAAVVTRPELLERIEPDPAIVAKAREKRHRFQKLYPLLKELTA